MDSLAVCVAQEYTFCRFHIYIVCGLIGQRRGLTPGKCILRRFNAPSLDENLRKPVVLLCVEFKRPVSGCSTPKQTLIEITIRSVTR